MKHFNLSGITAFCSTQFKWKGNVGNVNMADLRGDWLNVPFMQDFFVVSARTGKNVFFAYVFDEDGYDGEGYKYQSECGKFTIWISNY